MKVKKANVTEKVSVIEGFTKEFEEYLKGMKLKVDHKVTVEELKNSFTYTFATKALSLDSPIQVITVMNTIKDRYGRHLNDEAAGFLDCMCGKAYAYLSCLTTNLANQSKYQKLALSLFDKAYAKGYIPAIDAKMEFKSRYTTIAPYVIEDIGIPHTKEDSRIFYTLGLIYVDLQTLVNNAQRALMNKRPVIEDIVYFKHAEYKYGKGAETNCGCAVCLGLCKIIMGDKETGLDLVRKNLEGFKKEKGKVEKVLFSKDAKDFNDSIEKIETKILNIKKR